MAKRRRGGPKRAVSEPPTCNCALLCDDVIVSVRQGKHTLSGVIGTIFVRELPALLGGYMMYVRLSNVYPNQRLTVSLENARTGEAVLEGVATLPEQPDPLGVYTLMQAMPPFRVTEAGRYMFNAKAGGEILAQSPIMIQAAGGERTGHDAGGTD